MKSWQVMGPENTKKRESGLRVAEFRSYVYATREDFLCFTSVFSLISLLVNNPLSPFSRAAQFLLAVHAENQFLFLYNYFLCCMYINSKFIPPKI